MIRINWLKKSEFSLRWGAALAGALAGILGFLLKWQNQDFTDWRRDVLFTNEALAWITIPFLTGLAGVLTYFKTHFGTTNVWRSVTHLLEEYRQVIFQGKE